VRAFFEEDFDEAFKLAVPKSLAELALEEDWFIDGDKGVEVFQFERDSKDGPYCMLHMAMTVRRQEPRGPGQVPAEAEAAHRQAVNRIFSNAAVRVEEAVAAMLDELNADLLRLFEHRKRYYVSP
jgi:hypothetical protein